MQGPSEGFPPYSVCKLALKHLSVMVLDQLGPNIDPVSDDEQRINDEKHSVSFQPWVPKL